MTESRDTSPGEPHARVWPIDALSNAIDLEESHRFVTHEVAGWGSRSFASLLDFAMAATVGGGWGVWRWLSGATPGLLRQLAEAGALALLAHVVLCLAFEVATRGQTPGKNMCGLRVVDERGRTAGAMALAIRNLLRPIDWLPAFYLTGVAGIAIGGCGQRIGDRLAGTVVVHDLSLRDMLARAGVPASVYSTSEDGCLLESFVLRRQSMKPQAAETIAGELARHLYKEYAPEDADLRNLFLAGEYFAFLDKLYMSEMTRQA